MQELLLFIIAFIWLVGVWLRIYKQARYFQIEEYQSSRYLRWWLNKRQHLLPQRPLMSAIIGSMLVLTISEAPDSILPAIIAAIVSLFAIRPLDEGEIKKTFRRTQRATRLLGAAFAIAAIDLAIYSFLLSLLAIESVPLQIIALIGAGLLLYLTVPIILATANVLISPLESLLRGRFIASAKSIIADIQPTVIGITGSYGKTTTKTFVTDILNGRYKVYATPKSYNTMMGVCLAINNDLKDNYSIDYFVAEMGAYVEGEIRRICQLSPPNIGVVVEIGPQHLERFGNIESIVAAKYELIKALPPDGVGIFNWDNPYVREMYERGYPETRIAVSIGKEPAPPYPQGPRFVASEITESLDGLSFVVTDRQTAAIEQFSVNVLGQHNVTNILLATAIAVHEGMPLKDVSFQARTLKAAESRLARTVTSEGITIINDAYSANPVGIIGALKVLALHDKGKRLLITPGMVELGDRQDVENHKLGKLAAKYASDVILVGSQQTAPVKAGLMEAEFPAERLTVVEELQEAVEWYRDNLRAGDTILFLNDLPDTY
jgi:UDP-N-acetylmuramoyl-tripeptide--D-alanyl-D-alanine ligase